MSVRRGVTWGEMRSIPPQFITSRSDEATINTASIMNLLMNRRIGNIFSLKSDALGSRRLPCQCHD